MEKKVYTGLMLQARGNLGDMITENLEERINLNQLMIFMASHTDLFIDLGLQEEWSKIYHVAQAYKAGLDYEGNCLTEMDKLFKHGEE